MTVKTEATETTSTATPETSAATTTAADPAAAAATTTADPAAATAEAYTPNYKFKYQKSAEEKAEAEIDEMFRPLAKDKETEKKIRELHERAHGLDYVKNDRQRVRQEFDTYRGQVDPILRQVQEVNKYLDGNPENFARAQRMLNIPDQLILQRAQRIIQEQELPPEQRQALEERDRLLRENERLRLDVEASRGSASEEQREASLLRISSALASPEAKPVMDAFEALHGEGSFQREVILRGYQAEASGKKITIEQAVKDTVDFHRKHLAASQPTLQMPAAQIGAAPIVKPAVIPNVAARTSSPAARSISRISDIEKLASERNG